MSALPRPMVSNGADTALTIDFRSLTEADLDAVVRIENDVYVFPWTHGNFRDSLASGYDCFGAWIGHNLVGYSVVMTAVDEAHLLNLAVASQWQRLAIGAAVLRHVIERASADKRDMLYLEVRPSNIAGNRLYDRFGFKQLGRRRDYYPAVVGREDALFLGLSIAAANTDPS